MIYDVKCPVFVEDGGINVTSPFGWRISPTSKQGEGHKGVDITRWAGYFELATICAFGNGVVKLTKDTVPWTDQHNPSNSEGNYVVIDHGGGFVTKYFHLKHGSVLVAPGDQVCAGDVIGYMGTTGNSTGAHLHFQLEKDGVPIDALPYLIGEKTIIKQTEDEEMDGTKFKEMWNEMRKGLQDNDAGQWSEEARAWAVSNGLIAGNGTEISGEPNYMWADLLTREQLVTVLYRFAQIMGKA